MGERNISPLFLDVLNSAIKRNKLNNGFDVAFGNNKINNAVHINVYVLQSGTANIMEKQQTKCNRLLKAKEMPNGETTISKN